MGFLGPRSHFKCNISRSISDQVSALGIVGPSVGSGRRGIRLLFYMGFFWTQDGSNLGPKKFTSVSCCVLMCCILLCCLLLSCILLCCILLRCILLCCISLCCMLLCCSLPCCILLRFGSHTVARCCVAICCVACCCVFIPKRFHFKSNLDLLWAQIGPELKLSVILMGGGPNPIIFIVSTPMHEPYPNPGILPSRRQIKYIAEGTIFATSWKETSVLKESSAAKVLFFNDVCPWRW